MVICDEKRIHRFIDYMRERWKKGKLTKMDSYLVTKDEFILQKRTQIRFDAVFIAYLRNHFEAKLKSSGKVDGMMDLKEARKFFAELHDIGKKYKKSLNKFNQVMMII